MQPLKMYDTALSVDVDLYQLGLPDPFGANALICVNGKDPSIKSKLSSNSDLSALCDKFTWMTININRLEPKS